MCQTEGEGGDIIEMLRSHQVVTYKTPRFHLGKCGI